MTRPLGPRLSAQAWISKLNASISIFPKQSSSMGLFRDVDHPHPVYVILLALRLCSHIFILFHPTQSPPSSYIYPCIISKPSSGYHMHIPPPILSVVRSLRAHYEIQYSLKLQSPQTPIPSSHPSPSTCVQMPHDNYNASLHPYEIETQAHSQVQSAPPRRHTPTVRHTMQRT